MSQTEPVQCALCGWTGHANDLEDPRGARSCPACGEALGPDG